MTIDLTIGGCKPTELVIRFYEPLDQRRLVGKLAVVQIPGSALRMSRDAAIHAMENDKAFSQVVHDHARFAFGQIAQTAACNRLHHLKERCCRWLLIAHDSARYLSSDP
jgi:hypothetical protein